MQGQDPALAEYVEILEKTNQQLSLWSNPYGILVGALGVMIAVLAILFTFILWRQSKEYKEAFNQFLEEQKKIVDGEIGKAMIEAKKALDGQIESAKKKLKTVQGNAQEAVRKEIADLQKAKHGLEGASFGHFTSDFATRSTYGGVGGGAASWPGIGSSVWGIADHIGRADFIACSSCGHTSSGEGVLYCPRCGSKLPLIKA